MMVCTIPWEANVAVCDVCGAVIPDCDAYCLPSDPDSVLCANCYEKYEEGDLDD